MSKSTSFSPNWACPPGNTIATLLTEKSISSGDLAGLMNLSPLQVDQLLLGEKAITDVIADKLATHLGASTTFWLRREQQYQAALLSLQQAQQKDWLSQLPIKQMLRFDWINQVEDIFSELLAFFGVDSVDDWRRKYDAELSVVAFRKSTAFKEGFGPTTAWIRQGEIQADDIHCQPWNKEALANLLPELRKLTRQKNPSIFLPKLIDLCATCGVAVVVVRTPNGCFASGATKFVSADKAVMQMSLRYLSDDQFWFTFFHEVGHLLLHHGNRIFLEGEAVDPLDTQEAEANQFSADTLIPEEFQQRLMRVSLTKKALVGFALEVGISVGIIVGQLQFRRRIKPSQLNKYKRRYQWEE